MKSASADASTPQLRDQRHELFWVIWRVTAAFGSYFAMYGFRKPFTAGVYAETLFWGLSLKTVLVTSQVAGYALSKFIGIKIIAEMPAQRRAWTMLWLILFAEGALILFGVLPRPWNVVCLFLNGMPLGMVFGLVMGFLEGRRLTELLTAGLCASFILADGVTKSVGAWLLAQGITEDWMPSVAGLLFLVPFCICVAMLAQIPPPSREDIAARCERFPMSRTERWAFLYRYGIGLFPLVLMYLVVTIVRSIRADFAPEIWQGLGSPAVPGTFTYSEILVALGVLAVNGGMVLIRDNRQAFLAALMTCGLGFGLLMLALLARRGGHLNDFTFMVLIGLGLYLPYVAMHTTVFERLLGMTRERGNIGFLMYVADSVGYLGYVTVMLARNYLNVANDMLGLLTAACWLTIAISACSLIMSWWYFAGLKTTSPALSTVKEVA